MQNCVLRMLAFRQISNFIWRSNHMSKRKLRSSGFANGVLNSYNFIIEKDLFVENCSLCDYLLKIVRYNNDFQKKFYFPVDFWETLNYNRTSWDFSCKDP